MFQIIVDVHRMHSPRDMDIARKRQVVASGRSENKRAIRDSQRDWLRRVLQRTGETPSELAVKAGLADVTLTRFLNREDYEGTLSPLTLRLLQEYTGLPGPEGEIPKGAARGFADAEQMDYVAIERRLPRLAHVVSALLHERPNASPWVLKTSVLEGAGCLEGDIVIVEACESAPRFSPVCAQVYDQRGGAETVFRIFEPPVLTGANRNVADRPPPLVVDNHNVKIMGVVTDVLRNIDRS